MLILLYLLYFISYTMANDDIEFNDLPLNCHWSKFEQHLVVCTGIPDKPIYTQLVLYKKFL